MWFLLEGSPEKQLKKQLTEIEMKFAGASQRKKVLRELSKLEKPLYQVPANQ